MHVCGGFPGGASGFGAQFVSSSCGAEPPPALRPVTQDEATSALDVRTEEALMGALLSRVAGLVSVGHR